MKPNHIFTPIIGVCIALITLTLALVTSFEQSSVEASGSTPRINAPRFPGSEIVMSEQAALFWFGQVNSARNYADVRLGYNDAFLQVTLHIIDRKLWYDITPAVNDMTNWDAATLYLDLDGNYANSLADNSYRFIAQLNHYQPRNNWQAAYRWNSSTSTWELPNIPFTTLSDWRGNYPRDINDDRGWWVKFKIPFTSLGLSGPPADGASWGLALVVHDRDDAAGTAIPDQIWPEAMNTQQPSTWSELRFGQPRYSPPAAIPRDVITLRHNLSGTSVIDAHVGGNTTCGDGLNHWDGWGDTNYAGDPYINIQNQWDIADYSCFSKYYVTFPLNALPSNKTIISADLTLRQYGNSNPAYARPSYIQAATVGKGWAESTITWNNAPYVEENVASTWADPIPGGFSGWPAAPRYWDVSRAVAQAYEEGTPLRLALYTPDGEYHSGKYFVSSDMGDWGAINRPTLKILWGDPIFEVKAHPTIQLVDPGGAANFTIQVQYSSGFTETVDIAPITPPSGLQRILAPPSSFDSPGGQTTLTLTDTHLPSYASGLWYVVPITATSGSVTQGTTVNLLVNGQQIFLPLTTVK